MVVAAGDRGSISDLPQCGEAEDACCVTTPHHRAGFALFGSFAADFPLRISEVYRDSSLVRSPYFRVSEEIHSLTH